MEAKAQLGVWLYAKDADVAVKNHTTANSVMRTGPSLDVTSDALLPVASISDQNGSTYLTLLVRREHQDKNISIAWSRQTLMR